MKVSDLIDDALLLMGESPELCAAGDGDAISGVSLRRRLGLVVEESARKAVVALSPGSAFPWKKLQQGEAAADSAGCLRISLPDDFLMLAEIRLSGWERPVTEAFSSRHWLRRLQRVAWDGLRATKQRPLAFLTAGEDGKQALELYAADEDDSIEEGWYVAAPSIADGEIEIPPAAYMATLNHMVETVRI